MPAPYYPGALYTPNFGLALFGMDEVLAENMVIIDSALGGGGGTPGGTTGQVQYNNAGAFGGIAEGTSGWVLTSNGVGVPPSFQPGGSGSVTGSGTPGTLPVWTGASSIGDSDITDSGGVINATVTGGIFLAAFDGTSDTEVDINLQGISLNSSDGTNFVQLNLDGVAATATVIAAGGLSIGVTAGSTGLLTLVGVTSGQASISVADAAGTPNTLLLPITTGNPGDVLSTDGGNPQQLSWVSGSSIGPLTPGIIPVATSASTIGDGSLSDDSAGSIALRSDITTGLDIRVGVGQSGIGITALDVTATVGLQNGAGSVLNLNPNGITLQAPPANFISLLSETIVQDTLVLGDTGVFTGVLEFRGQTSGSAQIRVLAAAGTPTPLQLPLATGTSGQILSTDGANPQQLSWIDATSVELQTDGVDNTLQTLLNLISGTNISLVADALGGVTINASGNINGTLTSTHMPYATGVNTISDTPLVYDSATQSWSAAVGFSTITFGSLFGGTVSQLSVGNVFTGAGTGMFSAAGIETQVVTDAAFGTGNQVEMSVISGTPSLTLLLASGQSATLLIDELSLSGQTSGGASIIVAAAAGTPNALQLPLTTGAAGQFLITDGSAPQQLSWSSGLPTLSPVSLTGQTASIGTTTLYSVPASGAGVYRISYYMKITTAGSTSGSVTLTLSWTDEDDGTSLSFVIPTPANATNSTGLVSGTVVVDAKLSTNIQYATTYASSGGTAMVYKLKLRTEKI